MEIQDHQISKKCFAFGNSMSPSSIQNPSKSQKQKSPSNFKNSKIKKSKQNRSMDNKNLSIKAILIKYRCPFIASLFQKRPSCFSKRCLLPDS